MYSCPLPSKKSKESSDILDGGRRLYTILGDPGAVSAGGEKAKRTRKKFGRRKVKNEGRSPWDSSLNQPVPKPFKILACDWAQKYFLCPIRVQLFSCYFRDFLFDFFPPPVTAPGSPRMTVHRQVHMDSRYHVQAKKQT